jgi:hypothetical protein
MSIGASALAALPIAADPPVAPASKTPPGRTVTPSADPVEQPQAR